MRCLLLEQRNVSLHCFGLIGDHALDLVFRSGPCFHAEVCHELLEVLVCVNLLDELGQLMK